MAANALPHLTKEQLETGLFRSESDVGPVAEKPVVDSLRETEALPLSWLWPGRIPMEKVTLVKLVIIDSLSEFCPDAASERETMRLLHWLAGDNGAAIVVLAHWLEDLLRGQVLPSKLVQQEARDCGYPASALRSARLELGVQIGKEGFRDGSYWCWSLCPPGSIFSQRPARNFSKFAQLRRILEKLRVPEMRKFAQLQAQVRCSSQRRVADCRAPLFPPLPALSIFAIDRTCCQRYELRPKTARSTVVGCAEMPAQWIPGMDALFVAYLVLAGIGLAQAGLMLVHAFEHRRFYRRRLAARLKPASDLRVTLIAPCKGIDADLRSNLLALFWQRYPNYDICFVVESEQDPAVAVIRDLERENRQVRCRLVVAGKASGCGQKVHNLMCAAREVLKSCGRTMQLEVARTGDSPPLPPPCEGGEKTSPSVVPDILAFVDSDACPHVDWLARLIERIVSGKNAVATGYRWYVPQTPAFANRLLSAINNTIIGLTGPHGFNLVWGGAWAIRVEKFRELGLPDAWAGSLSDDLVVSRLLREARMRVAFEPHCLVKSPADVNIRSLSEFLRRQFRVVHVYAPIWWNFAFWSGLATNGCLWGTLAIATAFALTRGPWALPLLAGLAYYLAGVCRAELAARAVRPFLSVADEDYDRVARLNVWGWPLVSLATWLGIVSAAAGRTIVWRGIAYRMDSQNHTTIFETSAGIREEQDAHARTTTRAA